MALHERIWLQKESMTATLEHHLAQLRPAQLSEDAQRRMEAAWMAMAATADDEPQEVHCLDCMGTGVVLNPEIIEKELCHCTKK